MQINWTDILEKMAILSSKLGTERVEKVFNCIQDLHQVGQKYDEDIRNEAIRFIVELSQPK